MPRESLDQLTIADIESRLGQPDSILEKSVLDLLVMYYMKGGDVSGANTVLDSLWRSYVGHAQLATLACTWLKFATATSRSSPSHPPAGADPNLTEPVPEEPEEFNFLRQVVLDKFRPKDIVLDSKDLERPQWVKLLTDSPRGRQVLYQLTSRFPDFPLLAFSVRDLLHSAHSNEVIAEEAHALDTVFPVFHRKLFAKLDKLLTSAESEFSQLAAELVMWSSQAEHTWVVTHQLVAEVADLPGGYRLRAVREALLRECHKLVGPGSHVLEGALIACATGEPERNVQGLVTTCLQQQQATADDVQRLHDAYFAVSEPAPLRYIQRPDLLELLLALMMNTRTRANQRTLENTADLVAMATVYVTSNPIGEESSPKDPRGVAEVQARLQVVKESLLQAATLFGSILAGRAFSAEDRGQLQHVAHVPVVAYGLAHHVGQLITTQRFFADVALSRSVRTALTVLHYVAQNHVHLARDIVGYTFAALRQLDVNQQEACKQLLDLALTAMCAGAAERVMQELPAWLSIPGTDTSLGRYAVQGMLLYCSPPFTDEFKRFVLHVAHVSGVERFREAPRGSVYHDRLNQLLAECKGEDFVGGLTEEVRKYLAHIQGK